MINLSLTDLAQQQLKWHKVEDYRITIENAGKGGKIHPDEVHRIELAFKDPYELLVYCRKYDNLDRKWINKVFVAEIKTINANNPSTDNHDDLFNLWGESQITNIPREWEMLYATRIKVPVLI